MDLQHKSVKFDLSIKAEGESRIIEGYGAVFGNIDSAGDIILPGAFAESLTRRMPKMLYQHWSEKLIGVWGEAREDSKGLYIKGTLAKTPLADEAYELAKMGALDGMSIGYSANDYEHDKNGIRKLKKVELWEVSLVTFPANEAARVTGVKGHNNEREFEGFLRDAGYSREAAKIITARGFKALSGQRDAEAVELVSTINNAINILKG
jgi:uncharacterized protein